MIEYIRQTHLIFRRQNDRSAVKSIKFQPDPKEVTQLSTFSPFSDCRKLTKNHFDFGTFDLNKPLQARLVTTNKRLDIAVPRKFELEFNDIKLAFSLELKLGLLNTDVFIVSHQTPICDNLSFNKIGYHITS